MKPVPEELEKLLREVKREHASCVCNAGSLTVSEDADAALRAYVAAVMRERDEAKEKLAFLVSKGITVGPMKEAGKEPYLAYVIASGSELDDTETVNKLSDAEIALTAANARADGMAEQLAEARRDLEEIVCVVEPDRGVILLSQEGKTHFDPEVKCQVYDHQNFSPLGDALIALHEKLSSPRPPAQAEVKS